MDTSWIQNLNAIRSYFVRRGFRENYTIRIIIVRDVHRSKQPGRHGTRSQGTKSDS